MRPNLGGGARQQQEPLRERRAETKEGIFATELQQLEQDTGELAQIFEEFTVRALLGRLI
jgi:hypothetical protein